MNDKHLDSAHLSVARTPPMGWNSYDAFGDSVTEAEVLANARYMADHLRKHGWDTVVVDYRWYDPEARSNIANLDPTHHVLDGFGRLMPAVNRFPSATDEQGFGPLARKVHAEGLKFGIHIMRGISRRAVERNLPIFGSAFHAADATDKGSTCWWNPDMFGVRGDTPAGQAWYDALLKQVAGWGVDYIKVDDLSAPEYHTAEVEAIRRAIDKCGRPIVFSTSPGETPLEDSAHVRAHANLWRIQNDVWDNWPAVDRTFDLGSAWSPSAGPGHWPDADMLPLGHIAIRSVGRDRRCELTHDEQVTMMTLWALLPSPLMMGGNLPDSDAWTLALLTNDGVLAVNQDVRGIGAKRVWTNGSIEAWTRPLANGDVAAAFFNRGPSEEEITPSPQTLGLPGNWSARDLWRHEPVDVQGRATVSLPSHGALLLRLSPAQGKAH